MMIGNGRSKTAIKQGIGKYSQGMECVVVPVYFQDMYLLFSVSATHSVWRRNGYMHILRSIVDVTTLAES